MKNPLTSLFEAILGREKDDHAHVPDEARRQLAGTIADDLERRMREVTTNDPAGKLCPGCRIGAATDTTVETIRRISVQQGWGDENLKIAEDVLAAARILVDEAELIAAGKGYNAKPKQAAKA